MITPLARRTPARRLLSGALALTLAAGAVWSQSDSQDLYNRAYVLENEEGNFAELVQHGCSWRIDDIIQVVHRQDFPIALWNNFEVGRIFAG